MEVYAGTRRRAVYGDPKLARTLALPRAIGEPHELGTTTRISDSRANVE